MTTAAILEQLTNFGFEQTRKIYKYHGAPDNLFGVKVAQCSFTPSPVLMPSLPNNQCCSRSGSPFMVIINN